MSRRCRSVQRAAVAGPLSAEARAHVRECGDCASFVRARDALAAAMPQALSAAPTPAELARGARRRTVSRGRALSRRMRLPALVVCAAAATLIAMWGGARTPRAGSGASIASAAVAPATAAAGRERATGDEAGIPAVVDAVVGGGEVVDTAGWRRAEEPLAPYAFLAGIGGEGEGGSR